MSVDWQDFVEETLAQNRGKLRDVAVVTHQGAVLGATEGIRLRPGEIPPLVDIFELSPLADDRTRLRICGAPCMSVMVDLGRQMAVFDCDQSMVTVLVAKTTTTLVLAYSAVASGGTATMNTIAPYAERLRGAGY